MQSMRLHLFICFQWNANYFFILTLKWDNFFFIPFVPFIKMQTQIINNSVAFHALDIDITLESTEREREKKKPEQVWVYFPRVRTYNVEWGYNRIYRVQRKFNDFYAVRKKEIMAVGQLRCRYNMRIYLCHGQWTKLTLLFVFFFPLKLVVSVTRRRDQATSCHI